jgi:tetratricopeptide (TPR) repeat protein
MSDYMQAMSCGQFGAAKEKAKYKLPDTDAEKAAKAAEAAALKERGNAFFAQGERFEAAKLYEQAVLKFDWYSEAIADESERQIVLPVKIPCHLNLALMSLQLGNHAHAIVHCTQARARERERARGRRARPPRAPSRSARAPTRHALRPSPPPPPPLRRCCATRLATQRPSSAAASATCTRACSTRQRRTCSRRSG